MGLVTLGVPFWCFFCVFYHFGRYWEAFDRPRGVLGRLGGCLGGLGGSFGSSWGVFGVVLGGLGVVLGGLWGHLGRPWGSFGNLWDLFGASLGPLTKKVEKTSKTHIIFDPCLEDFGCFLDLFWNVFSMRCLIYVFNVFC